MKVYKLCKQQASLVKGVMQPFIPALSPRSHWPKTELTSTAASSHLECVKYSRLLSGLALVSLTL